MNNITTLRDIQDQDAALEYWLESDRIGTLCRNGRTVYYATVQYRDGITVEGATREDVARGLYRYYNEPSTCAMSIEIYRTYANDYLTADKLAADLGLTRDEVLTHIELGRAEHDRLASELQQNPPRYSTVLSTATTVVATNS